MSDIFKEIWGFPSATKTEEIEESEIIETPEQIESIKIPEKTITIEGDTGIFEDAIDNLFKDAWGFPPPTVPKSTTPIQKRPVKALEEDAQRPTAQEPLEPTVTEPQEPKIERLPEGHPGRFSTKDGMLFYDSTPELKGDVSKPPIPKSPQQDIGNIDLTDRPTIENKDGSLSTIRSISFNEGGKEILIPTVREGLDRAMSDQEAIDWYHQTGEYLGKFNTVDEANAYAKELSSKQEARLLSDKPKTAPEAGEPTTLERSEFLKTRGPVEPEKIPPALPSYGAAAMPVRTAQPKPKPEKMGLPEAMGRSFAGGAADLALNFARTPQTAAEVYLALNNYTNRAINAGIKKVTEKEKGPLPEIPLESIPDIIKLNEDAWDTKAVRKFAESQKEAIKEVTNSKGVVDNLAQGNFSEAGKSIGIQAAAQVPLILSMIAGGAVGASSKVLGGFAGATQSASDMDQYWKDVEKGVAKQSPEKAAVNAFFNGALEMFGESKVTGNIIEDAMKVLAKKTSEDVAKKAVGNAVGAVVGKMLKSSGAEMTEETFVNYSQAVMDKLFGKRDVTLLEAIKEGIEGGIIGFFTSAGTTGPLSGIAETKSQQRVAEPRGQLTEIVDEETGETRPIGEAPAEYGTLADYNMDIEEFNRLPEEEQTDLLKYLSPEEQQRITDEREKTAAEEADLEENRKAIAELEQKSIEELEQKVKGTMLTEPEKGAVETEEKTEEKPTEEPAPAEESDMYKAGVEYGKEPTAEKIPEFKNDQERMEFWSAAKETIDKTEEKVEPKPEEAERGLQRETETEIEEAEQPGAETVTEPVDEPPVPAPKKKPVPKKKKEKPSDQKDLTGVPGEKRVRKEPVKAKPVEETGEREAAPSGVLQAQKEIKTPKGVTAEVKNVSKKANLKNEKTYEPVLDLNKKPTGWVRPKNNKSVLIDPFSRKQVVFKAEKPEAATAKAKTNTAATGYAIKNPLITEKDQAVTPQVRERLGIEPEEQMKEEKREPTGKVSGKAPVSPAKPTKGKVPPTAKTEKKEVTGEEKPTAKKPPVAKKTKPAPKAKKPPKEKPKFAKRKEERSEPFYSPLLKATQGMKQDKFTADQLKSTPGVKQAEWDWIGMDDFFKGRKSATKAEVEQFIADNQTEIEEVRKGEKPAELEWNKTSMDYGLNGWVSNRNEYQITQLVNGKYRLNGPDGLETFHTNLEAAEKRAAKEANKSDTEHSRQVEPGGENYREVLITLPEVTDAFYEGHYAEPNVIAHFRINDREVNGEKVLFIEEIQSDWSLKRRKAEKKGIRGPAYQPFLKNWHELTLKRILRMAADEGYDRVAWITGKQTARRYDLSKMVNKVTWLPNEKILKGYYDNSTVFAKDLDSADDIEDYIGEEPAAKLLGQETTTDIWSQSPIQTIEGEDLKIGGKWAENLYDKMVPLFLKKYGKKWGAKVEDINLGFSTDKKYEVMALDDGVSWDVINVEDDRVMGNEVMSLEEAEAYAEELNEKEGYTTEDNQSIPITEAMKKSVLEEGQPLFAKKETETPPTTTEKKKVTPQEKELTDIVYDSVDKEPKYGAIQIVEDVDPKSDIGVIGKVAEETTGKKVVFIKTDDRSLKPTLGFTIDGLSIPGATKGTFKDTIFINVDSNRPLMWTAYHEFAHFLETNENYKKKFWDAVKLTDAGKAALAKEGQSELTADIIGEMMSSQEFWDNLAKQNRTAAQKIMQEFLRIVNKIAKDIRAIIRSEQLTEEQKPKYEELLTDVTAVRDELAQIYSDYKKTTGKQVGKIPTKMAAAIKKEKVAFAKKEEGEPEKKKPEAPVRKEPLNPFKKIRQKKITDDKNVSKEASSSLRKSEEAKRDIKKASNRGIKERLQTAKSYIGEWLWDRVYYAKQMLGDTPAAKAVIGKINAVKGFSNIAKLQYEKAVLNIIKNLPYELEDTFEQYLMNKRISEIEKLKGQGKIKHPKGMTEAEADAFVDHVENKTNKKDALGIKIAAARYWRAMLDQLEQLHENGIISDRLFEKLKKEGKYYSPRRFIQHIDPNMRPTDNKGRKISVRESGIQSLEKGSEEAMILNWRLLLSETVASTQSRIARNKAAKGLADFVRANPDNDFDGEIEDFLGEETDLIDAEGMVEGYQGELVKLRQALEKAETGAARLDIKHRIDDLTESIDIWGNRIDNAREKGEDIVFIEHKKQPELPQGMERIYFREDGEAKAVLVSKRFADSWNNNDVAINHVLAQTLNLALGGAFVRPFATGVFAPEFALSNIPRDMALQWIATQEYSKAAPVALIQNLDNFRRVFGDAWYGKGRYVDYVNQGGGMEFLNEGGSFFRKDPTKAVTPLSTRYTRTIDFLKHFQEFSERLTRLALREQAIKNGKSPEEATRIAREYLDFSQGGSLIKGLDSAIPYLNASVQGGRSVTRAFKEDKAAFSIKALQLITMGAALALVATKFRRDEWDDISDREKVGRWNFPLWMSFKNDIGEDQHIYLSIPKDQSSRIFATLGEIAVDRWQGAIDGETAWKRVLMAFDDISPIDAIGMFPPVPSAIAGYNLNKNFWKEDDIWKGRENISPYMEYYEGRTPKAYIDLSEKLNDIGVDLSPERFHQSLQQTLPKSLFSSLMGGTYEAVTAALSKEDKQELDKKVFQHWSQYPVIRKYIRATYPSKTDYEKMTEKLIDYNIPLYNKKGQKKSETMLKHEIRKKERALNDLRQQHDNEAAVLTMLFLKEKPTEKQLVQLIKDAHEEMGVKEVKRILNKIVNTIEKPEHAKFYEAHQNKIKMIIDIKKDYEDKIESVE